MGYDDLDRALLGAWYEAIERYRDDPAALDKALQRCAGPTYTRPLRSWALVLRADDKRVPDNHSAGVVRVDAEGVRTWCAPIVIDEPGVSLEEAARRFGVNRTTVARWASPAEQRPLDGDWVNNASRRARRPTHRSLTWRQDVNRQLAEFGDDPRFGVPGAVQVAGRRLMLEHTLNRANPKRSETRVWTPWWGVDPGGAVWSGDWGALRAGLAERLPSDFEQVVERVDRRLGAVKSGGRSVGGGPASRVMQWVCPRSAGGCGAKVAKLYLPMPAWTLMEAVGWGRGDERAGVSLSGCTLKHGPPGAACGVFRCRRCSGLLYESSERTSSPGVTRGGQRRRVDAWGRFVKRISAGLIDPDRLSP